MTWQQLFDQIIAATSHPHTNKVLAKLRCLRDAGFPNPRKFSTYGSILEIKFPNSFRITLNSGGGPLILSGIDENGYGNKMELK